MRELGSLGIAIVIVLSVCGVAVASMAGAEVSLPAGVTRPFKLPTASAKMSQAIIDGHELVSPVAYRASIRVRGWKSSGSRVLDLKVVSATPIGVDGAAVGATSGVSPAYEMAQSLRGSMVLASVTTSAAVGLPKRGSAVVRLVAVPQGATAGLVIDTVYEPTRTAVVGLASVVGVQTAQTAGAAAAKPRVSSLSTYYGSPGTQVTMTGSGFGAVQGSSAVRCAGVAAQVLSWSDTRIVFLVPTGVSGTGYVGVSIGASSSNGVYFVFADPPVVTSISPREGAPGTVVTVSGRNFGVRQGGGWVSFAGLAGNVVSWSDTAIRVVVPRGASAGYSGVVANGMSSNGVLYGPYGLPFVSSVSSRRVSRGDRITIIGRDFGTAFGKVVVGDALVSSDSWSDTRVTFTVAKGVRSDYVGVLRDDAATSNGSWVNVVPRMASVSRWWAPPGEQITLTGTGFEDTQGAFTAYVGGVPAQVVSWSDASVKVIVPAGAALTGYAGVGSPAACSNGIQVVVENQPRVAGVSASSASRGDTVRVTGSGFGPRTARSKVVLGGAECVVSSWSDTAIEFTVPSNAWSGYVGVVRQYVASNGVWLAVAP